MADIAFIGDESLEVVERIDRATGHHQRRDFFVKRFAAQGSHPEAFVSLGASQAGPLVGFVCCHMQKGEFGSDDRIAVLDAMAVDPQEQKRGLGHALMARLKDEIQERGGTELQTQAGWNQPAVLDFFVSTGFRLAPRLILERSTDGFSDPTRDESSDFSTDDVVVRSLAQQDIDPVVRIDMKITGHNRREFYERKFQEVLFESGVRLSLIAEVDGMVVGFMMARVDFGEFGRPASEAVIDTLGVTKAFRAQHVGEALLSQLLGNLRILNVDSVRSEVEWNSFGLLGFLGRCGFSPSQRLALSCPLT